MHTTPEMYTASYGDVAVANRRIADLEKRIATLESHLARLVDLFAYHRHAPTLSGDE